MLEIERKFLVSKKMPRLSNCVSKSIEQYYLSKDPDIRIRKESIPLCSEPSYKYTFSIKTPVSVAVREETEIEISKESYESLLKKTDVGLSKMRYEYPTGDCNSVAEIDVYTNTHLKGLKVVEVEFPTQEKADRFIPPDWFGQEITGDERYSNASLAYDGVRPTLKDVRHKLPRICQICENPNQCYFIENLHPRCLEFNRSVRDEIRKMTL